MDSNRHNTQTQTVQDSKNVIQEASIQVGGNFHLGDVSHNYNYYIQRRRLPPGLRQLPKALKKIATIQHQIQYKHHLSHQHLPYYSRDKFKKSNPHFEDFITESEILQQLLDKKHPAMGCVIYGQGGSGKTRLMLELGMRAMAEDWQVWLVGKKVKSAEVLADHLEENGQYLLLFEYIEENDCFEVGIQEYLEEETNSRVLIVGNCRNTYQNGPNFPKRDSFLKIKLDNNHKAQQEYEKAVIEQILRPISNKVQPHFLKGNIPPSFAVFWRHYHLQHPTAKGLAELGDFKEWVQVRLAKTFSENDFRDVPSEAKKIMLCLPLDMTKIEYLQQDFGRCINLLIKDGWMEERRELFATFHDSIIDELMLTELENRTWIAETFQFAKKYNCLNNWLRTFERIQDRLDKKQEAEIEKIIDKNEKEFLPHLHQLAISPLQSKDRLMKWLKRNPNFVKDRTIKPKLTSKVLVAAIRQYGCEVTLPFVRQYRRIAFVPDRVNWIIIEWLYQKGDPKVIKTLLKKFLKHNADHLRAEYVLNSWLRKVKPPAPDVVKEGLCKYLDKHGEKELARFLIQNWLDAKGSPKVILPYVQQWLSRFAKEKGSCFLFQKWLKNKGRLNPIQPYLEEHLTLHCETFDSRYVLQAWLETGKRLKILEPYLEKHLKKHATEKESRFLIQKWLEKKGRSSFIQPFMLNWLEANSISEQQLFVLNAWLKAKGKPDVIEDFMVQWVNLNEVNADCVYTYINWLGSGGKLQLLEPAVNTWLKNYPEHPERKKLQYFLPIND